MQTLRYLVTGLPYDVWWALVDRQINAIFLALNAVVGAIVTIALAVMFFGPSILTVLISVYVVWVRLNYIERIFFTPQAKRELKGVYGGRIWRRLRTANRKAIIRLARRRRRSGFMPKLKSIISRFARAFVFAVAVWLVVFGLTSQGLRSFTTDMDIQLASILSFISFVGFSFSEWK